MLQAALAEADELRQSVQIERERRLAAENLAVERQKLLESALDEARRWEQRYVEAVNERMKSLDSVNVALIGAATGSLERSTPPLQPGDVKMTELKSERRPTMLTQSRNAFIKWGLEKGMEKGLEKSGVKVPDKNPESVQ